jgi:dTDP-4-amino-4,6-dideoxygalactose transaminase
MKELMRVPLVDLHRQHTALDPELKNAFEGIVRKSSFIGGAWLERFENDFAQYCGSRFALGVSSGTAALELAMRACGVGPGDEVLVPAFTFVAPAASVSALGGTPVFVDVDSHFYTLDIGSAETRISPRTKAVIPVHLYGQMADMECVAELARRKNLVVIEDAAQAHGARLEGKPVGSWGRAAAFSFYPTKNLGAWGDAGAVITEDAAVAHCIRLLRNHGSFRDKYCHEIIGYNHRLDALQAAVLAIKLKHLDGWNDSRRQAARRYREALQGLELILPDVRPNSTHVYHLFVVRTSHRDVLREFLQQRGVETGLHYPIPLHLQAAYQPLGHVEGHFPVSERLAREVLCLPMFPGITSAEIDWVAKCVCEFFQGRG